MTFERALQEAVISKVAKGQSEIMDFDNVLPKLDENVYGKVMII